MELSILDRNIRRQKNLSLITKLLTLFFCAICISYNQYNVFPGAVTACILVCLFWFINSDVLARKAQYRKQFHTVSENPKSVKDILDLPKKNIGDGMKNIVSIIYYGILEAMCISFTIMASTGRA